MNLKKRLIDIHTHVNARFNINGLGYVRYRVRHPQTSQDYSVDGIKEYGNNGVVSLFHATSLSFEYVNSTILPATISHYVLLSSPEEIKYLSSLHMSYYKEILQKSYRNIICRQPHQFGEG